MSVPARLETAVGLWAGPSLLWFAPGTEPFACESTADLQHEADGRMLALRYAWSHEGKPHAGVLLLGDDPATGRCDAAWADSFHNGHRLMPLSGDVSADGTADVLGRYAAPPGPDWGWRIVLDHPSPDLLLLQMYNITPDGQSALAVEARYGRRR
jgi:hypothetical protein